MRCAATFAALLLAACTSTRVLPPVQAPDLIRVERSHSKQVLAELKDPVQIDPVVGFINARLGDWTVPWYGPPIGQVYLVMFKDGKATANFYIGPWFFGRDYGEFLSQNASEREVAELGALLGIPLVEIVKDAQPK
jgi:hypothetical protein